MVELNNRNEASIPVVVLAGGRCKADLTAAAGVTNKALVKLAGKPMISYVLAALAGASYVSKIVVVGDSQLDPAIDGISRIEETDSFLGNIKAGILAVGGKGKVLIVTSDIPLLKAEMVDDFIEKALATGADLCYPIISKEDNDARFPEMKRTFVKLKDGTFTGGNFMLLGAEFLLRNESIVNEVYEARKKPLKLAGLLDWGLLIRLLLKRATISQAEKSASRMLHGELKAVITRYPEIGADVDKPGDIMAAEGYLAAGSPTDSR